MKILGLSVILFFSFVHDLSAESKLTYKFFQNNQQTRGWWEYIPVGCGLKECPLVMAFHEGEGSGDRFDDNIKMTTLSDRHNFILIYPNGISKNWNDGRPEVAPHSDDITFVDRMLEEIKQRHKVDAKKIYATGLSNGGLFTFRLACERANVFAAIAPVAANMGLNLSQICQPSRPVPILNIVGTEDKIVPMTGGEVKGAFRLRNLGRILSSNETLNFWIVKNKCSNKPNVEKVIENDRKDGTHALLEKYEGCSDSADVYRWVIGDGGHTWPSGNPKNKLNGKVSQEINASEVIWDFFAKHPMN